MKNRLLLSTVAFFLLAGSMLWYGGFLPSFFKKTPTASLHGETKEPPPEVALTLPAGYAVLHDYNPDLPLSFKEDLIKQFNFALSNIHKHPDSLWAWVDLGSAKDTLKDYKGAETAWLYATKLDPNHTSAYGNLAQLYWQNLKNYPKAEQMFLKVIELNPNAIETYRDLSDLYRQSYKEKADRADKILLRGLKENPGQPSLLSALASYYYEHGQRDLAIKYYEELVVADPANMTAKDDLAHLKAGKSISSPN